MKKTSLLKKIIPLAIAFLMLTGCAAETPLQQTPSSASSALVEPVETQQTEQSGGLKTIGQIGGPTQAVEVSGDYAYFGIGSRLVVMQISDMHREVGYCTLKENIEDITAAGDTLYVSEGGAGLAVADVSDPSKPTVLSVFDTQGFTEGVVVKGNFAYTADGPSGLRIIDISDKSNPKEVSSAYGSYFAFGVSVKDGYAYIAAAGAGLLVADVSDPENPKETGLLPMAGYAYAVTIAGDTAYVANGWDGVHAVDISKPEQMKERGKYDTIGWTYDIAVDGSTAYVTDSFNGIDILDVSDPSEPFLDSSYATGGNILCHIAFNGETVYAASRNGGLYILDAKDKKNPVLIGSYSPMGYADDIAVSGNYAYVAAGPYGLRVIDISDIANPLEVSFFDTLSYATGVEVKGNYVYVICYGKENDPAGLFTLDVSDPAQPKKTAFCSSPGMPQDIIIDENAIFIANESGIESYDISIPASPKLTGFLDFSAGDAAKGTAASWGVAVKGDTAYVTHCDFGLEVVDISDISKMSIKSNFVNEKAKKFGAIALSGDHAYVSDGSDILIADISDPKKPKESGAYMTQTDVQRICASGNMLYVAGGASGVLSIDVSDPANPVLKSQIKTGGYALGIEYNGDYVFAACGEAGLFIIGDDYSSTEKQSAVSGTSHQIMPVSIPVSSKIYPGKSNKPSNPVSITVTSTSDSGQGTLREALDIANKNPGTYIIIFDFKVFSPEKPAAIYLLNCLSLQGGNVTIDASNAGVILDGSKAESNTTALEIMSDHNNVKGLQIINFSDNGISISGSYNTIGGDRSKGKGPIGEGNMVSGNKFAGIYISSGKMEGLPPSDNIVIGNLIGTDINGNQVFGNNGAGVFIGNNAACNIIGGQSEADRNIISGNGRSEVSIMRQANRNTIAGNYIGVNAGGTAVLGNAVMSVSIELGGYNNTIKNNVIGNSSSASVTVSDWGSWGNSITGNYIGTDASGEVSLNQSGQGIGMNASFNRIGGNSPGEGNVVSGTGGGAIKIGLWGTNETIVSGNLIGTDATGTKALGNDSYGITLYGGECRGTFIGGASNGEANIIGGNNGSGILAEGGNEYNYILGNFIGTNADGTAKLTNAACGIEIKGSDYTFIQNNLFVNSSKFAIYIKGNNNRVCRNIIYDICIDEGKDNRWDDGKLGNYWVDYMGMDAGGDGIGDSPYTSDNITDMFPIMQPSETTAQQTAPPTVETVPETTAAEATAQETTAAETVPKTAAYNIGGKGPAGGYIFYINPNYEQDGWRYLEAAPYDQGKYHWYNGSYVNAGATDTYIGSGLSNTGKIINAQGSGNYAAYICYNLVLGGYDDWFLPSKDELNLIYNNLYLKGIGGFSPEPYSSSSEVVEYYAWLISFYNGLQYYDNQYYEDAYRLVRAVRAFN